VIIKCTCSHDWQDKTYGQQMRVMNKTKAVPPKYRCTVCGKEASE